MTYEVLVIGAGPAGAAAARALALDGHRVLLCDKGPLPRHRLCGEFLSPEAASDLETLGLDVRDAGAVPLDAARLACGGTAAETRLARPAFGVSRHVLDAWLAEKARAAGAELRTGFSIETLAGRLTDGFVATARGATRESIRVRTVIGAFGKQAPAFFGAAAPRAAAHVAGRARNSGWVALKAHFETRAVPPSRIELYGFRGGYVGRAPVGRGRVNVCAVLDPRALPKLRLAGALGALRAVTDQVPALARTLGDADPHSVVAESGAAFGIATPVRQDVLLAGDAAAMPHPLGGDGMAMALRAGILAAAHVRALLHGHASADGLAAAYAQAWKHEFASRLRWCSTLHGVLVRPALVRPLLGAFASWPGAMRFVIERTRGAAATREDLAWHRSA